MTRDERERGSATGSEKAMESLGADECLRLLNEHPARVGRVAVAGPRPMIFPVNYQVDGDSIVFRTDPGSKLDAAVRNEFVAFEVDWVDPSWEVGWSVLIRAQAKEVVDPDELARLRRLPLRAWAPGERDHYVRIFPEIISGRRIR
jgi:uncharacterized protein